jgi:hypothetical protein
MPPRTVEDQDGMGARSDGAGDLGQVKVHGLGICEWQDETGGDSASGTGGSEEVCPFVSGVTRRAGPGPAARPNPSECALLSYPCFVLEPDLDRLVSRVIRDRFRYRIREVFLKNSCA